ncbi:class I adenylate-forming enzyme family protein [Piscinibacter defluvii]|uniref:class I adenylate-forming enzyme family protein n=1 Tax=Piscinibacter defluvii TaxID=1796922 RepID=UPI000FDD8013|nr:AMP-binding protein [Piscinibacter defluvii]
MLLQHAFEHSAARLPGKVALVAGTRRLSYAELQAQVHGLAGALVEAGVAPGDRVLVMLENTPEFAVAVHAVLAAGAVFVPISALAKTDKLAFIANDTHATALVTEPALAPAWRTALARIPTLRRVLVAGETGADPRERGWPAAAPRGPAVAREPQDLAALIYTSGTTGRPKGVMLSHHNMTSAWAMVQAYLGLREDDVIGLALPPAFSYGLYNLLMGLGLGATVVQEHQAAFPVKLAETLVRERVTVFPGVPTLYAALLDLLPKFDLSALRLLTNAAAALPEPHLQRLRAALPQARLLSMYGLTECKRASYLEPDQLERRPGSVGRGIPGQEHWLIDEQGQRLPHGSTGQLVIRGPHVMLGYWERPEETAERLRPGTAPGERLLYTGDLFRSDAEGYLYYVARLDDIIKTRGEKVAPREVENVIYQLDGVTGCAVVGVPDEALGQAVRAYVTLRPGCTLTERELIRHCLARLESYMAPKSVAFVDELPRTDSGKIRHASLR